MDDDACRVLIYGLISDRDNPFVTSIVGFTTLDKIGHWNKYIT